MAHSPSLEVVILNPAENGPSGEDRRPFPISFLRLLELLVIQLGGLFLESPYIEAPRAYPLIVTIIFVLSFMANEIYLPLKSIKKKWQKARLSEAEQLQEKGPTRGASYYH